MDPDDPSLCMACGIIKRSGNGKRKLTRSTKLAAKPKAGAAAKRKRRTGRKPGQGKRILLNRTPLAGGPVKSRSAEIDKTEGDWDGWWHGGE